MDPIKEAFQKVKEDMNSLKEELDFIKKELAELRKNSDNSFYNNENSSNTDKDNKNIQTNVSTDRQKNQTDSFDTSTQNLSSEASKSQNFNISTRNQGVPTDRQTDRQTNRQTDFAGFEQSSEKKESFFRTNNDNDFQVNFPEKNKQQIFFNNKNNFNEDQTINNAAEILDSLDSLKKEIRLKFKRLTEQEFLIFSTLYQIDQDLGYASYKDISERLNLTESSIRDYIGRIINKGIPVDKNKINNKNIQLKISENLKKIATLPTIIQLRDI